MSAIQAINLSKNYRLEGAKEDTLQAVSNVSFELNEGESVGIIGRNGAGKSTLLKLLSGVTLPTSGEAMVTGTFSSLLEVGIGFHPDLSGRDNIYLNASILGISKKDVSAEISDILDFANIERFIDQPLRTYSSGMKLRLAFSIIAHLKTDIIALDEVLAVGDSMFQVKCMNRIFDFKQQGRTILFVSHNLSAVKKLCERTLVIENGEVVFDGPTDEALQFYAKLMQPTLLNLESKHISKLETSATEKQGSIQLSVSNLPHSSDLDIGINIGTNMGMPLYHFSNRFIQKTISPRNGTAELVMNFEHCLKPGTYPISIFIGQNDQQLEWQEGIATLTIPDFNPYGFHNPTAIQGPVISTFSIEQKGP